MHLIYSSHVIHPAYDVWTLGGCENNWSTNLIRNYVKYLIRFTFGNLDLYRFLNIIIHLPIKYQANWIQPPHPSPFNLLILRHSTSSSFAIQPPHPSPFNLLILRHSTSPSLRPDSLTEGRLR